MESYMVNEKEKEIDIKQLLFYILDNIKWLILVGLLCGVFLGAYGYVKTKKLDSRDVLGASIQDVIQKNKAKWNGLDASITADAFADPLPGTYIANVKLSVDFDYSSIEGNDNLDFSAMNGKLQGDAIAIAGSNESKLALIDDLNLLSYEDMENLTLEDLKYMTSIWFSGANIMQIQVVDTDSARATNIANALATYFVANASQCEVIDNVKLLEGPFINYSSVYRPMGQKDYFKNMLKFGLLGIFLGVALSGGICILIYLFNETIRTKDDIGFIGLEDFAMISSDNDRKEVDYRRLIYNISLLDKKDICIVSVDACTPLGELKEKLMNDGKKESYSVKVFENMLDNPEVIFEAKKSDITILLSTYGKTLIKNLNDIKKDLVRADIEIAGVILVGVKH